MNLNEAKQIYLQALAQRHFARGTLRLREILLNQFFKFLGNCAIGGITKAVILSYLASLVHQKKKPSSIQGVHVVLRSFFRVLYEQRHLGVDLSGVIIVPKRKYHITQKVLTEDEVKKFLSLPDVKTSKGLRDRAILEMLYSSALRNEELINLDLYDVNEKDGTLFIRQGKGRKDRIVPIGKVAIKWLKKYLAEVRRYYAASQEQSLFVSLMQGTRLKQKSLSMLIKEYHGHSGIPKRITPHTFRHTCATHMLKNDADIRFVQEMLGHTSAHTTEIYTHLDIRDLKEMITRFHPRKNLAVKSGKATTPAAAAFNLETYPEGGCEETSEAEVKSGD